MPDHTRTTVDDIQLAEIEAYAIELARGAGAILSRWFGTPQQVEYKDKNRRDPVTGADVESQKFLAKRVSERYPDHGFLGEETGLEVGGGQEETVAPDLVWVVDPLDGTTNFVAGFPVYASSIGVLYRGAPVAGAIYIPWPDEEAGVVMHARKGGGAFVDGEPVSVFNGEQPEGNRLITLPGAFPGLFRIGEPLRDRVGEVRNIGSTTYDVAMTAKGVLQYTIPISPRLWDVAAGTILVIEAGGTVVVGRRTSGLRAMLSSRTHWEPLETFIPSWRSGATTLKDMRRWSAPLVVGSPGVVRYVADNLKRRRHWRRGLSRAVRRLGRRSGRPTP